MNGCVINSSPNLDEFTFNLALMTYCNYCVIQLLKSQEEEEQQQLYPILGPLCYAIAVKKVSVVIFTYLPRCILVEFPAIYEKA